MSKVYVPLLHWRCTKCDKHGTVEREATADCLTVEQRLIDAHAAASPECDAEWGNSAIATAPIARMPE